MALVTLADAAARLGLQPSTLRHQVANGRLRAEKVGPVWVIEEAELERYRAEHLGTRRAGAGVTT